MSSYHHDDFPNSKQEREKCSQFLQNYKFGGASKYLEQMQEISDRVRRVFEIDVDDIFDYKQDEEFVNNIMTNTSRYIQHFEEVVDDLMPASSIRHEEDIFDVLHSGRIGLFERPADGVDPSSAARIPKRLTRRFEVSILPSYTQLPRKLREVKAADIGHLVRVKGMVTRASDVKPQVSVVTYTCETCNSEIFQEVTGLQFMPLRRCLSQQCTDNNTMGRMSMQTRGSRFIKYQELRLQELPDQVPVGHIPRAMTIHCRGEKTRQCGPGDIVTVAGIFLTMRYSGFRAIKAGLLGDTYLEAMSVEKEKQGYESMHMHTDKNISQKIEEVRQEADPYSLLASSIAPEIFGHEDVKKALLLQMVGGVTKVLPDGMKIRGDINVCLMGDPGVAKSQLLKYIATSAPRGVYTTGKGSSSAGLTAAVVRDPVTNDMALEGGALVLADRGICCIDEFDKMDESDRTAIHEVMEQQTISIAKAGITTTLNARAAVLAAANPLYGRYNRKKSISDNVDLPNSLLSRFDLLFLLLDKSDRDSDVALARHVLHVHRFRTVPDLSFVPLEPEVIKQYIGMARKYEPTVPAELSSFIVEAYVELRAQDGSTGPAVAMRGHSKGNDQTAMTPRQLLSILRLGQALARLRCSHTVSNEDIVEAIRLIDASKSSLHDDEVRRGEVQDPTTDVFNILRDHRVSTRKDVISFAQAEAMVVKKGYTESHLRSCLDEYAALDVLYVNDIDGQITFRGALHI